MASPSIQTHWLQTHVGLFLTDDRVVLAQGDDARSWINGQLTSDVRALDPTAAVYSLAVTVKGRILSDLWVVAHGADVALVLPTACADQALESLERHIIMEDVELTPQGGLRVLTLQGPKAEALLAAAPPELSRYAADRLGQGGFDLWLPEQQLGQVLAALEAEATKLGGGRVDPAGWAQAHVVLGVPRAGVDFGLETYPQEAGLKTRAVSFNKGCYQGQEVVYMLENRGKLARRLVQLEAGRPPADAAVEATQPGDLVQDESGVRVGEITSVTQDQALPSALALAYIKRPLAEVGQTVVVGGAPWRVRAFIGLSDAKGPAVAS